eukprot:1161189-Pelagomonas_calceolata.AAC.4
MSAEPTQGVHGKGYKKRCSPESWLTNPIAEARHRHTRRAPAVFFGAWQLYTIMTSDAERIGVDQVAKITSTGKATGSEQRGCSTYLTANFDLLLFPRGRPSVETCSCSRLGQCTCTCLTAAACNGLFANVNTCSECPLIRTSQRNQNASAAGAPGAGSGVQHEDPCHIMMHCCARFQAWWPAYQPWTLSNFTLITLCYNKGWVAPLKSPIEGEARRGSTSLFSEMSRPFVSKRVTNTIRT